MPFRETVVLGAWELNETEAVVCNDVDILIGLINFEIILTADLFE